MSADRSREFHRAARRVLTWCAIYTRGLDPAVAAARQDEIASDLHEHATWATETGVSPRRLGRSILHRAALGAASDLQWRRRQQRGDDPALRTALRANSALLSLMLATGAVLAASGIFTIARVVRAIEIGDIGYVPKATITVMVLTVVAIAAMCLVLRRRFRVFGALLLAAPALLLFPAVGSVLWVVSASTVVVFNAAPWWGTAALIAGLGIAMGCLAAAGFWWSVDFRSARSPGKDVTHA
jgi:hypothetical protein